MALRGGIGKLNFTLKSSYITKIMPVPHVNIYFLIL